MAFERIAKSRRSIEWKEGAYTALCGCQCTPLDPWWSLGALRYRLGYRVGRRLAVRFIDYRLEVA